jgi:hypothetical protein
MARRGRTRFIASLSRLETGTGTVMCNLIGYSFEKYTSSYQAVKERE